MNPSFTSSISIIASPARVMSAFFDPRALALWWQTTRSVTVPRVLGAYALEWEPTEFADEMLGRLGGTLHGTVMDYKPEREFFVADAFCASRLTPSSFAGGAFGELRAGADFAPILERAWPA